MILDPGNVEPPEQIPTDTEIEDHPEEPAPAWERPMFLHPQWMVGVVLIFAVLAIFAGFNNPVWFLIGAPCILVLAVYLWVRATRQD